MAFTQNDTFWLLISSLLIFLMQVGFVCLQIGLTPSKNNTRTVTQALLAASLTALLFWIVGYGLLFGTTQSGIFGTTAFTLQLNNASVQNMLGFFIFQMMLVVTTTAIIAGVVMERMRLGAYLISSAIIALLVYPLYGHWVWNGVLDGMRRGWLGRLGFYDFAGATVVHGVAGWAALAIVMLVGAGGGRFDTNRNRETRPITASNSALLLAGVVLLLLGWFGFTGGSQLHFDPFVPVVFNNTLIAGIGGLLSGLLVARIRERKITSHTLIMGSLAGLVAISAGTNAVSLPVAMLIGVIAGVLAHATAVLLERQQLDDPIGVIPVHLTGAIWGTLAAGLFGDPQIMLTGLTFQQQIGAQLVGIAVNGLWSFGVVWTLLALLRSFYRLRVGAEEAHPVVTSLELGQLLDKRYDQNSLGIDAASHYNGTQPLQVDAHFMQADLEQTTKRYRTIVDHSRDGIIIFGQDDLEILTINPAALQLFAVSAENSLDRPISDFLNLSTIGSPLPLFRYINDSAQPYPFIGRRADGLEFPIEITLSATIIDGEPVYISSIRDITERAAQQSQLEALNADLVESNLYKDAFLASMSHELRTPLNVILGMSEALEDEVYGALNNPQRTATQRIQTSGRHLLEIIDEILDLSAISAGQQQLDKHLVSIKTVCQASLDLVSAQADTKEITLSTKYDPSMQAVVADPKRLKQILVNLLNNAIKFTPTGGRVGLMVAASPSQEMAHFVVWDTGVGIEEEALATIFQPFVQADNGLNRQYGGTGLGLAIVQRLVELHAGTIQVSSELNKGSRFVVSLPWKGKAPAANGIAPSSNSEQNGHQQASIPDSMVTIVSARKLNGLDYAPPAILLAEDNEPNIATIGDYLKMQGYRLHIARNGLEALELYEQFRPNIILMDIQMPKMDGLTAIRKLRESHPASKLPIIALTAFAMPGDRDRTLEAGASAYLVKPISLRLLVQTIQIELNKVTEATP